jgi:ubiquinone/menaquinone biosynthesis C-methylase UbiE
VIHQNGNEQREFWKTRAEHYDQLEWATKSGYLRAFLDSGRFQPVDEVLDVGTGTGIIAHNIAPYVRRVIGIDISPDMMKHAMGRKVSDNVDFLLQDVRDLQFAGSNFTKVTARMVFHHILHDIQKAMSECHRILQTGGQMFISEGVPPDIRIKDWYTEMFKLKEERQTFMEGDLVSLMAQSGFVDIRTEIYISERCSIRNWLVNSGLPQNSQDKIMQMHFDMPAHGKAVYRMIETEDDCLIDMKFVTVIGRK